jgi:hypothetical protein
MGWRAPEPGGPIRLVRKSTTVAGTTDIDVFISLRQTTPGTLEDLHENLYTRAQQQGWAPPRQNVSIGINYNSAKVDLVPGRLQPGSTAYHSNRTNEIRLMKIWRQCHSLAFPSFYVELMTIRALPRRPRRGRSRSRPASRRTRPPGTPRSGNGEPALRTLCEHAEAARGESRRGAERQQEPKRKGRRVRAHVAQTLRRTPAASLSIGKGNVIDCDGTESDAIDIIIIYDRHYTSIIYNQQGYPYIPAESGYAVLEAKQQLDKQLIEYAGAKAESVRKLK